MEQPVSEQVLSIARKLSAVDGKIVSAAKLGFNPNPVQCPDHRQGKSPKVQEFPLYIINYESKIHIPCVVIDRPTARKPAYHTDVVVPNIVGVYLLVVSTRT